MNAYEKKKALEDLLKTLGKVAVAFSSGVDSTFLLSVAHDVLGENAVAVTARSCAFPKRELAAAEKFCRERGIEYVVFDFDEFKEEKFALNPENRCYYCKKRLFTEITEIAKERGITHVIEGSNLDDEGDYRPGLKAIKELGVISPLRAVGLTKADIRLLSKEAGLPTWDKPSLACLASRIPYGERITKEKLQKTEKAEEFLLDKGFTQVRVRSHGNIARIEVLTGEFYKFFAGGLAAETDEYFKSLGYDYVSLDLGGYKTGNMNKNVDN